VTRKEEGFRGWRGYRR